MSPFWIFLAILILQRVSELFLARRNERVVRAKRAREFDEKGYKEIVLMRKFLDTGQSVHWDIGGTLNLPC